MSEKRIEYRAITCADYERIVSALPEEEAKEAFRQLRERECFPIINRGALWYDTLDEFQKIELADYYQKWLDVTKTLKIPEKPSWLR